MTTRRQTIRNQRNEWEVISIGAHKFWKVPSDQLLRKPVSGEAFALLGPIMFDVGPDAKLHFPSSPPLEGAGPYISSGVAVHTIGYDQEWDFDRRQRLDEVRQQDLELREDHVIDGAGVEAAVRGARIVWENKPADHLTARQMVMFSELDWYGECFQVLEAHGWTRHGKLTSKIVNQIDEHFAQKDDEIRNWIGDLHGYDDEEKQFYYLEIAATVLAVPLSRLWYAASMVSLYYLHQDDLRVGYLWCEYCIKMRFEIFALKHIEMTERNRESGRKGGQGERARQRYEVLDRAARASFKEFAFSSDTNCLRSARRLATEHDKSAEAPLFSVNGKLLSNDWFGDWLAHFRELARGVQ